MSWIKKGLKEEWKSLHDFRTWMLLSVIVGIPWILNLFINFNLQIVGLVYFIGGILLFVLQNYKRKSNQQAKGDKK